MNTLYAIDLVAQRSGDLGDIVILVVIILASVFTSVGKWIANRINERKEREAALRGGAPTVAPAPAPRQPLEVARPLPPQSMRGGEETPPFAGPVAPTLRRVIKRIETTSGDAPAMGRMLEVILEQATGMKIQKVERRPAVPASSGPPAPPKSDKPRPDRPRVATPRPSNARPPSIAEREQRKATELAKKRTRAERETALMETREAQLTRETDQRLGHVETHIAAFDRGESDQAAESARSANPMGRVSLRDALILREILSPPLALREDDSRSW